MFDLSLSSHIFHIQKGITIMAGWKMGVGGFLLPVFLVLAQLNARSIYSCSITGQIDL